MEFLTSIIGGFVDIFHLVTILAIVFGVIVGIIVGALPGLTAAMGVAIFTPLTFTFPPQVGINFLLGLYCGGHYGGSITAVLINTPGTASNIMTAFDGYPMAQQGKGGDALYMGLFASFFGGIFSALVLLTVAPVLARFALRFGPAEYFALTVFGLSIISSVAGKSMIKGLLAGLIGILLSVVGMDTFTAVPRFNFGYIPLLSGFELIPVLIGVFAVAEVLYQVRHASSPKDKDVKPPTETKFSRTYIPIRETMKHIGTFLRSSVIGTIIGIIPGPGGGIAGIISYNATKRVSKNRDALGKGAIEGIAASESASNAVTGGALVPLLTLGIPGDAVTAVLIGAFMIQGLQPGPLLFQNNPRIIYALLAGVFLANIAMYVIGRVCIKFYVRILRIPILTLAPVILILSFVGSYALGGSMFNVLVTMVMGVVGYFLRVHGFPMGPIVIGLILGPMAERGLRQALTSSQGDWSIFIASPISAGFLVLTVVSLFLPMIMRKKNIKE
jgi:putative tricarboxylic transport membrane protein